ncbi:MAG: PQQ-dependent sugar dehydrogenase [Actinomycetota bacterium]|nr:PQQ-dependent sugar dehydrogenase [Actinomycetota bacterium]
MIILAALVVGGLAYIASTSDSSDPQHGNPGGPAVGSPETTQSERIPIEETLEYIRSNEPCPPELEDFDSVPVANFGIALEPFIDLPDATVITFADADSGFVGVRAGTIWAFGPNGLGDSPVIDLSDDTSSQDDQGLLGMTLHPSGDWLYLNRTNGDGDSVITAYPVSGDQIDQGAESEILVVDQPSRQHNGGDLAFGPDGYLYVSFGDGGGLGDPRHHGQDPTTVLGSILRLDVDPTATPRYQPAPGNPYRGDSSRNELIWAIGIRNPFRLSFDRVQGDL